MKKILNITLLLFALLFTLASCTTPAEDAPTNDDKTEIPDNENDQNKDENNDNNKDENNDNNKDDESTVRNTTVFLAGDSTVKTYEDDQYIGGWGQYIEYFLDDSITVANAAQGGRSSRSFINEGRLYDIPGSNYSFSQNDGKSIGSSIKVGDFLFIQFGHNDDNTKMQSSYATMYDRMVPLGTPDANGIYPVTEAQKTSTSSLPSEYTALATDAQETAALAEIAKYGATYYAYDGGGTYKWYLKQYIDFAREKGATPVLVTPVARVKFQNEEIIGGAGLHGENFAYVQAVRQLAEEEDCLLVDLFADTKEILETATPTYANYLMALKPNDLVGTWPDGYDSAYGNTMLGYTGIEATHYNKYGAFITAAKCAEAMLTDKSTHNNSKESFTISSHVLNKPSVNLAPSNLISKSKITEINALFKSVDITNENINYKNPQDVIDLITAIVAKGDVTVDNYLELDELCQAAEAAYNKLNIDDRPLVTNYAKLVEYQEAVEAMKISQRPVPTSVVTINANSFTETTISQTTSYDNFKILATSDKTVTIKATPQTAYYNNVQYEFTQAFSMGGSATFGTSRCIEITTTGKCSITVFAKSTGTDDRIVGMKDASGQLIHSFDALQSMSVNTFESQTAGTFYLGSTNKGIYIYQILIEYFS